MTSTRAEPAPVDRIPTDAVHDIAPVSARGDSPRTLGWSIALAIVVAVGAVAAALLHRNGHTQGDDFALYLRQARSIFEGNVSQVVADNRFTVINSGGGFSPYAYPWGFPLLLSPFVHLWGLDYDRLKLVEVACFCVWVVLVHGIVRRRAGRVVALAVAAVIATAPALLAHTDQLLSEFPHAMVVGIFLWWFDRVKLRRPLLAAPPSQLVVLGVLGAAAYNVRRESVVLIGVILIVQFGEVAGSWYHRRTIQVPWRTIGVPHVAFIGSIIGFQLLLPSMLLPDNGDSPGYIGDRLADYAGVLTQHLGIDRHPVIGWLVLALAVGGMIIGCALRPRLDVGLVALTVLSALTVSTHLRMVDRYYFQILPWVLYFATMAIVAAVRVVLYARIRRQASIVAVVPLLILVAVHLTQLPGDISDVQDRNSRGIIQTGPSNPNVVPIFEAVARYTEPDATITYFRARTMTLLTDRRAIQTKDINRIVHRSDYYAELRGSTFYQPELSATALRELGFVEVWSNKNWVLWRVPAFAPTSGS